MKHTFPKALAALAILAAIVIVAIFHHRSAPATAASLPDMEMMKRDDAIYSEKCAMCHQAGGLGVPPSFPPLAKSDWLMEDRARAVKVLAEGLEEEISVNGARYNGKMPAQMLDDGQAAEVLTFITNSWGNEAKPFTVEEVAAARRKSRFPTYEILAKASSYQPLAEPPPGWKLEEVALLPEFATRFAGPDGDGIVYLLMQKGSVQKLSGKTLVPWLAGSDYLGDDLEHITTAGIAIGPEKRLWITSNNLVTGEDGMLYNDVHIWRSKEPIGASSPEMASWFNTRIPFGIGPYNHGVSHIAFGSGGAMYVSSGSRTDSGELGTAPNIAKAGETELTSCIWRFDGGFSEATSGGLPHIVAHGIRNPYGFAWDDAGNLLTAVNGPDAHLAEEMDMVEEGKHYGFPYQFANHSPTEHFYEHTPPAPPGLEFTSAMENIGPDGGQGYATFTPHSCPGGMMWCGDTFPEPLKNRFLVTRFGNYIKVPNDTGFDVLTVKPSKKPDGRWQAEVHTVMSGMGRPVDVLARGDGSILILEYTRSTDLKSGLGMLPGRITALSPE